ncbi:hypothetical protein STRIP9103_03454 [Streptomyces ipomoeae 91-03]|uniref:Uncharacterized protein n=1 Tax=Streptomyces ipomoeae 91-03 TaxID=698759 RepID=L1KYQ7_9ACTN|nr:hypothetical protein STRIP9103_03454 [Streptomyces ipomoeae 91-03]
MRHLRGGRGGPPVRAALFQFSPVHSLHPFLSPVHIVPFSVFFISQ